MTRFGRLAQKEKSFQFELRGSSGYPGSAKIHAHELGDAR